MSARRRSRDRRGHAWLLAAAAAVVIFVVGVAVGESLHDNPRPGVTTTRVTTILP